MSDYRYTGQDAATPFATAAPGSGIRPAGLTGDVSAPTVQAALERARVTSKEIADLAGLAESLRAALRGAQPEPATDGLGGLEKSPSGGLLFDLRAEQGRACGLLAELRGRLQEISQAIHGG